MPARNRPPELPCALRPVDPGPRISGGGAGRGGGQAALASRGAGGADGSWPGSGGAGCGPAAYGWQDQRWRLARVTALNARLFDVRYTLRGTSYLLHRLGFTSQATLVADFNHEGDGQFYDSNGFLVRPAVIGDSRPHDYRVAYLGYNGDGHIGRWNVSASFYAAIGRNDHDELAGKPQDIRAGFAALEVSRDFSWARLRMNLLVQSADRDPFDSKATGFDAILENPLFAGADTSFWIRQAVPLVGGGGVALSGRNGVLASLRSSKDQGQANFSNPGLLLAGAGADFDLTPQVRAIGNVSYLRFGDTTVLGVLRNQAPPSREIGWDVSAAVQWRPFMTQNIVVNASAAALLPGKGLKQLYDEGQRGPQYSLLTNVVLTF